VYVMSRIVEMILEAYRRAPSGRAFVRAAVASLCLAMTAGIAGGVAASYLYDRANSKGDDLAVLTGGWLAIGTFVFVILFTWLRTLHHQTSWANAVARLACLFSRQRADHGFVVAHGRFRPIT
jgi:hypothetical protein